MYQGYKIVYNVCVMVIQVFVQCFKVVKYYTVFQDYRSIVSPVFVIHFSDIYKHSESCIIQGLFHVYKVFYGTCPRIIKYYTESSFRLKISIIVATSWL